MYQHQEVLYTHLVLNPIYTTIVLHPSLDSFSSTFTNCQNVFDKKQSKQFYNLIYFNFQQSNI